MKLSLFNRILIGFLIALLLILGLGALDFISSSHLISCYRKLEKSKDKVLLLEETASMVKDIQRAHRGFVVTKDKRFLDPYYHSLELIPSLKARLGTSIRWKNNQRREIAGLLKLIDRKVDLADKALLHTSSLHVDTVTMKIVEGKIVVDSINASIARLKRSELEDQEVIQDEIRKWVGTNRLVIATSIVTFMILLAIGLYQIRKALSERYRLYSELRDRSNELSQKNEELNRLNEELNTSNENLSDSVRKLETMQSELSLRQRQLNHAQLITRTGSFTFNLRTGEFSHSDSYGKIFGLEGGKTIQSFPDFVAFVHPEDRDFILQSKDAFLTNPNLVIQEFRLLVDGRTKYIRAAGQIIDDDGSPVFLGAITDATELTEAHENLRDANQKLLQSNADLEAFTYSISHDLKAPIRSMLMYIHLLLDKPEHIQSEEEKKWLNVLLRKGRHMDELIEGLLALSRYGSVSLKKQEVSMGDLVRDIVDEMIPEYPRAEISLATPLGKVNADESLIRQVWINLLGNSLKFSAHVEKPKISISRNDQDGFAAFSIRDNGVGFDEERASELFTVFRRLHNIEEFSGSGVGLAIVKRIIVSHGGDIEAHGQPGKGSTFTFRLPK